MVMFFTEHDPIATLFHASLEKLTEILVYQPPVGMLLLYFSFRLSLRFQQSKSTKNLEEYAHIHQMQQGRSWILDTDDKRNQDNGGVEVVRRHLCRIALRNTLLDRRRSFTPEEAETLRCAVAVLNQIQPSTTAQSRLRLLNALVVPLDQLDRTLKMHRSSLRFKNMSARQRRDSNTCDLSPDQLRKLVQLAFQIANIRFTDALVRLCRDHALQSAHRLARTVEYWERKNAQGPVVKQRLLATAAYTLELERLGRLESVLMRRPSEPVDGKSLVSATIATAGRSCFYSPEESGSPVADGSRRRKKRWKLLRKYYFRWREGGLRKLEGSDNIDSVAAAVELLRGQTPEYEAAVQFWVHSAHDSIRQFLDEAWSASKPSVLQEKKYDDTLQRGKQQPDDELEKWRSIMSSIVQSSQWLRIGEGQKVRLGLKDAWLRVDRGGVPSAVIIVFLAHLFHTRVYVPQRWPDRIGAGARKSLEIWNQRVWVPVKEIYDDLLNKQSAGIMSALSLAVEQASLDKMLQDLNLGDGTSGTRQSALEKATEEFEATYQSGVLSNLVRGRLLELLLLQMQQLKVGLLTALDYIDVLLKGNQINFKLMAAIPAGILFSYLTRLLLRQLLYNIRAKDIRPLAVVHGEMTTYLNRMEALILGSQLGSTNSMGSKSKSQDLRSTFEKKFGSWATDVEQPETLGEFLLCIHRYLILLDYGSPPFAKTDHIHAQFYRFLGSDGSVKMLDTERHLNMMNRLQQSHKELLKST